jgi:hypothetical protein
MLHHHQIYLSRTLAFIRSLRRSPGSLIRPVRITLRLFPHQKQAGKDARKRQNAVPMGDEKFQR